MRQDPLVSYLRQAVPELLAIYCCNSPALETAPVRMDPHIALLAAGLISPEQLWPLADALLPLTGSLVEVVDLRTVSPELQHQLLAQGRRLWAADVRAGLFEWRILNERSALERARQQSATQPLSR